MKSRSAAAALAGLLAYGAGGCASAPPTHPLSPALMPPLPEPSARLVLIGDAGVDAERPALAALKTWLGGRTAPARVVFLGDDYYPHRVDERAPRVLDAQLGVGGDVTLVPGNHDWHPRGLRAWNRIARGRIDALAAHAGDAWQPRVGELGPAVLAGPGASYRVLAIDSELWRVRSAACARAERGCEDLRAAERALAEELACATCAPAIVVAHHPLRTVGEHGGCEASPLRSWITLGGQDLHARPYRAYIASLERVFASARPLLFAAGHDHSLQFSRDAAVGVHVVSGAGAKTSPVCGAPDTSWSLLGFAVVEFASSTPPLLRMFALGADGAPHEVLREPLAP